MENKIKDEKNGGKNFFQVLIEKIDKKMEEKSKSKPCCGGDKKDDTNSSSCCN